MAEPNVTEEMLKLIGKSCDGTISPEEAKRLNQKLEASAELREAYLAYARLNGELMWRYRTGEAASKLSALQEPTMRRKLKGSDWGTKASLALLAVAVVMLIALSAFWAGRSGNNASLPGPIAESGPSDQGAVGTEPLSQSFVATLLSASTPVWAENRQAIDVGSRIEPGAVSLESGEAEIVFDSGAKLVVSGPAKLDVESSFSAYLDSGKLAAHMPPSAIGFRVRTPTSELVDQGTEFGVVAEPGGASEVHVFRGQVDVQDGPSGDPIELIDGQAMRFETAGRPGERIAYSKNRFGGLALRAANPIQWTTQQGGNGHYYQLVVLDRPISWHEAALKAMRLYHNGLPGHLVTVTSAEEDRFLIDKVIQDVAQRGIWIGLTDVLRESHFRWVTGEPLEYSNWASYPSQQPDNYREADWHGGEDYGMYTSFVDHQPWAWNDLSVDSIHEKISAFLVEFEPPVDALQQRSMTMDPIEWPEEVGGNGHSYRLVLSLQATDWKDIQQRASESSFNGSQGHLVVLETQEETDFIVDNILRVCGIPENMIGLSGSKQDGLTWVNGQGVGDIEIHQPFLPTSDVYGLLRWDHTKNQWSVQTRAMEARPANWFGYLIEYP
ncbi:lectin-like protein [Rhodopirellula sp. JC639]|uniref:lectin-like protein n=1 Tax=Stieleria mannarensis TaxID=2755585 RepID=UPI0016005E45|nr:lectin-like protein [Rhodopirellula sp. JC639]